MAQFPLDQLGGRQVGPTTLGFGVFLPWVTPANGQDVRVLVLHENDQLLTNVPAVSVPLTHTVDPTYGDLWTGQVDVSQPAGLPAPASWGQPGSYVYRLVVDDPTHGCIDWIVDPYARDFGVGRQSAVRLGGSPFTWTDDAWRTPAMADLVMYEINLSEFGGDATRAQSRLAYLADLGINCVSVMPVTNVAVEVDWGYLPVGYFGADERLGGSDAFRALVDAAHGHGIAVVVDAVYGHASRTTFAYQYLYDQLHYDENPFMGPFAQDLFSDLGASTDYRRQLTRDFFLAVNTVWLDQFHVDGFRYDCVPNYWDGPTGVGFAKLAYDTHDLVQTRLTAGGLPRFATNGLLQIAEQLEDPVGILWQSYAGATWQDGTLGCAQAVAAGAPGAIPRFGAALGLAGFPTAVPMNGTTYPKTALQYIETHDHSRFIAQFGTVQTDEAGNYLFLTGDRSKWFKLQPYLIALLAAKGVPMLFEGQELCEDFTLPGNGLGRVALLRPVDWDYFYDDYGRATIRLVRRMIALRHERAELRGDDHWLYDDGENYQAHGVMIFRRQAAAGVTVVAVNFTDADAAVQFAFPEPGEWTEQLSGGAPLSVTDSTPVPLVVPSNYGQVWTLG